MAWAFFRAWAQGLQLLLPPPPCLIQLFECFRVNSKQKSGAYSASVVVVARVKRKNFSCIVSYMDSRPDRYGHRIAEPYSQQNRPPTESWDRSGDFDCNFSIFSSTRYVKFNDSPATAPRRCLAYLRRRRPWKLRQFTAITRHKIKNQFPHIPTCNHFIPVKYLSPLPDQT